jgi:phage terminase large subunit-like protein
VYSKPWESNGAPPSWQVAPARDEAGYGKIDPLMALFNAAALMAMNPELPFDVAAMIV